MQEILKNNIITPSYIQLKDILVIKIRDMEDGFRIPSIRELIKIYKVSQTTVEKALFELEKENLIQKVPGRGIFANKSRSREHLKHLISAVVSDTSDKFESSLLKGIGDEAAKNGYNLLVINYGSKTELNVFDRLKKHFSDGVIIRNSTKNVNNPSYIEELGKFTSIQKNCISAEIYVPDIPVSFVGSANYEVGYDCAKDFVKKGYKNIVFIWHSHSIIELERLNGFKQCLQENNIEIDQKNVRTVDINNILRAKDKISFAINKNPVAVFNACSKYAFGILSELKKANLQLNKDVYFASIVEQDYKKTIKDSIIAYIKPSYQMGIECAKLLINRLEGGVNEFVSIRLKFRRESLI